MRAIALILALTIAASNAIAQSVHVFSLGIDLGENCEVAVHRQDGKIERFELSFSPIGNCRLLPHSETDIPRIEYVEGEYVLLVESSVVTAQSCRARLAAITVSQDGHLRLSEPTQHSSACGSAERKDFEILRHRSRN